MIIKVLLSILSVLVLGLTAANLGISAWNELVQSSQGSQIYNLQLETAIFVQNVSNAQKSITLLNTSLSAFDIAAMQAFMQKTQNITELFDLFAQLENVTIRSFNFNATRPIGSNVNFVGVSGVSVNGWNISAYVLEQEYAAVEAQVNSLDIFVNVTILLELNLLDAAAFRSINGVPPGPITNEINVIGRCNVSVNALPASHALVIDACSLATASEACDASIEAVRVNVTETNASLSQIQQEILVVEQLQARVEQRVLVLEKGAIATLYTSPGGLVEQNPNMTMVGGIATNVSTNVATSTVYIGMEYIFNISDGNITTTMENVNVVNTDPTVLGFNLATNSLTIQSGSATSYICSQNPNFAKFPSAFVTPFYNSSSNFNEWFAVVINGIYSQEALLCTCANDEIDGHLGGFCSFFTDNCPGFPPPAYYSYPCQFDGWNQMLRQTGGTTVEPGGYYNWLRFRVPDQGDTWIIQLEVYGTFEMASDQSTTTVTWGLTTTQPNADNSIPSVGFVYTFGTTLLVSMDQQLAEVARPFYFSGQIVFNVNNYVQWSPGTVWYLAYLISGPFAPYSMNLMYVPSLVRIA